MHRQKTRILLADDHALMRMGLRTLLEVQGDMEVVGEAEDGEGAVRAARELKPDVVVMDLVMPGFGGAEATRRILEAHPETRVIILTAFGDAAEVAQALALGAAGAQMKGGPTETLLSAIRTVRNGGTAVADEIRALLGELQSAEISARQKDILELVARGLSTGEIARHLGISNSGVKQHLTHICQKLGAANRSEATAIAIRRRLIRA